MERTVSYAGNGITTVLRTHFGVVYWSSLGSGIRLERICFYTTNKPFCQWSSISPISGAWYVNSMDCIFCKIVSGEAPCYKIWEDEKHLAFLSIFPNTKGFSVVVTKEHHPSYVFDLPNEVLSGLTIAAGKVAKLLDKAFDDVGRTGMIFEGFGVDHVHAKLFPMHGTKSESWKSHKSNVEKYFENYEGYISSHDFKRADDAELAELAKRIRGE